MNRLRILLITTAVLIGSSALASAEEFHPKERIVPVRVDNRFRDDHVRREIVYPDHRYDPHFWRFDVRLNCWVRR